MSYTTYLFDFDYTLADSSRGIVTCFRLVLDRHGYTDVTDEEIKRTIGKTLEESFSILTGVTDAGRLEGFKNEYRKEADTHMTINTVLFLETKSVLLALKDAGASIGIISTKYRFRIKELVDVHFPGNFFDIIVGGEDVKAATPSHEGVTTAEELSKYPHWKIMSSLEELLTDDGTTKQDAPSADKEAETAGAQRATPRCGQGRKVVCRRFLMVLFAVLALALVIAIVCAVSHLI